MRLRFVVPRRGRRAGLGGLAAAVALALALAGCGGGRERQRSAPTTPATPPGFAIGIDERNPHLLAPGPQPTPAYTRMRDALAALKPSYVRVLVNWATWQPDAGAPPDWARMTDGCIRGRQPCAPWRGLRDQLRTVRALGAAPVLVVYGTPGWAAQPPEGCERARAEPGARMPRLEPYRALLRSLAALARAEGVEPYWSPWNEPNAPNFLEPQRARCDVRAPSLAARRYAQLVRAAAGVVGAGRIVLGEASGIGRHTRATGAAELAGALPSPLVCSAAAWSQHAYVSAVRGAEHALEPVPLAGNRDLLTGVESALAAHGCAHPPPIWITETGVGDRPGACADMAAQLRAWRADPQVEAAFQYTFRDDPLFPVGLADPALTRLYPAYEAWRSRGQTDCR